MSRCPLCPRLHAPIHGIGPSPAMILAIGDAPGKREVETLRRCGIFKPLDGDAERELINQYLPLSGLTAADLRYTNLVKCTAPPSFKPPSPELATSCSEYWLHRELRDVQPTIIVTLGATALHTLFPGHSLEMEHGIPFSGSWGSWSGIVVPMYSPGLGLTGSRFMIPIRGDWTLFGKLVAAGLGLTDWLHRPEDEYPEVDYKECVDAWDVRQYMEGHGGAHIAIDTEVEDLTTMAPYCLSFSHTPGTSRVIRAASTEALHEFHAYLLSTTGHLIYHNGVFDPPVLASMGLTAVLRHKFRDTMMMSYHYGKLGSQSLKVLAYRLAGMFMKEYEDVVVPHSQNAVALWLAEASARLAPAPSQFRLSKSGKNKGKMMPVKAKTKTGNEKPYSLVTNALTDLLTSPTTMDPWKRWKGWLPEVQEWIDATMDSVPMPISSITHVPWSEAMYYAARDADATIRIYPVLRKLTANAGAPTL